MARLLRIVARLTLLAAIGGAVFAVIRRRSALGGPAPTTFAPTEPAADAKASASAPAAAPAKPLAVVPPDSWKEPINGGCPDGYPVKANSGSGIYHVPGGRFYDRTVAERCYATEAEAEADGYRRAKA